MSSELKTDLKTHILQTSFPCMMAKAVMNKGFFHTFSVPALDENMPKYALENLHNFVTEMHSKNSRLSSCAVVFEDERLKNFDVFEKFFWKFLKEMNQLDKAIYEPDPSVDADPKSGNFSYSIKSESFFIIALHPDSPRWARRFKYPTIVFNPHKQFEEMRSNGTYIKIRDLIRLKDKLLQGTINPMLQNFGERSEVWQYLGKTYDINAQIPLMF